MQVSPETRPPQMVSGAKQLAGHSEAAWLDQTPSSPPVSPPLTGSLQGLCEASTGLGAQPSARVPPYQPVLNSTCASKKPTMGAVATFQPCSRARIRPSRRLFRTIFTRPGYLLLTYWSRLNLSSTAGEIETSQHPDIRRSLRSRDLRSASAGWGTGYPGSTFHKRARGPSAVGRWGPCRHRHPLPAHPCRQCSSGQQRKVFHTEASVVRQEEMEWPIQP